MIVGCGADTAEAKKNGIFVLGDEADCLFDKRGIVVDDKRGLEGMTVLGKGVAQKGKVCILPASVEDFGTDDKGVNVRIIHTFTPRYNSSTSSPP